MLSFLRRRTRPAPAANSITPEVLRKIRALEVRTRGLVQSLFSGEYASVFHGRGLEFSHVRQYQFGDDVRAIDWKVTARRQTPYVRQFVEERDLLVVLIVDISASGRLGPGERSTGEVAAEVSAALAFAATRNNDRIALLLVGDSVEHYVPPGSGRKQVMRVLASLLTHEAASRGTRLSTGLDRVARHIPPRATIFLISDFILDGSDPEFRHALARAARIHDLVAIRLAAPTTGELPNVGWVELRDPESGRRIMVNTASRGVRRRFRERTEHANHHIAGALSSAGVETIEVDTSGDALGALAAFFRRRQRWTR